MNIVCFFCRSLVGVTRRTLQTANDVSPKTLLSLLRNCFRTRVRRIFREATRSVLQQSDLLRVPLAPNANDVMQFHTGPSVEREPVIHRPRNQSRHVMTVGCVARNQQDCPARKPVGQLSFQSRL